jgi:hypothetical protein
VFVGVSSKLLDISITKFEEKIVSDLRKPRRKTFSYSWMRRREKYAHFS